MSFNLAYGRKRDLNNLYPYTIGAHSFYNSKKHLGKIGEHCLVVLLLITLINEMSVLLMDMKQKGKYNIVCTACW